jgi:uncharacterized protein (TIGR02001 family)
MRNMKKLIGVALAAGATVMSAGAANAEVSGSVALVSDYVFRGISQTDGGAAIQGSLDWSNDTFYAGVWGSNVNYGATDFTELASMELDAYVGFTPTTGPVSWDIALVGYFYPNADDELAGGELDYYEGIVGASFNVSEQFSVGGQFAYTPEYFGETGEGVYYEVNAGYAVSDALALTAAYGIQDNDFAPDSYSTWNVGGAYAVHGFTLGLTYSDTEDAFENGYSTDESNSDGRVVFSIGREL